MADFLRNVWLPTFTNVTIVRAVARKGGGETLIKSSHRFGLSASSPNLSESSLAEWAPALRLRCAQPRAVRARYASPQSPPAKLDSDKFGSSRRDQTGWLGAASPQDRCWGLRPQTPAGSPPQTPLGLRPRSCWGLPPRDPLLNGVWGGATDSIKPTGLVSPRGAKFV